MSDDAITIDNPPSDHEETPTDEPSDSTPPTVEELYPIALLMDELRHDDVASRVQAMRRLDTIALALGPDRTRSELLPFLEDVIPEDEDEVIAVAAEELGNFIPFVGGPSFATLLIPVLEKIAACEEPIVRAKSIDALNNIADELTLEQITSFFIPLIHRLAKERWFSLHIAATGLFRSVLLKLNTDDGKLALLNLYDELVHDDSPMVRKAAAKELPHLADLLSDHQIDNPVLWAVITKMYQAIVDDDQDSVKFLSVNILVSILKHFNRNSLPDSMEKLFQSLLSLIKDPSWRVRYMVADRFDPLASGFNDEVYTAKLVPHIISLMKDSESEVRKAISAQLPPFAKLVNEFDRSIVLDELIPIVNQLSMDESDAVRASLASQIANLAPVLGKEVTIKHLLPILVEMLKDDFSEVRLNIISNLHIVNDVIGIQLLSESLLPAITELAHDRLWRVRLAIIKQIPLLAKQLGLEFFDKSLGKLCMDWLWDPVFSVREAAVKNLTKLTKLFGEEWCKTEVIQKIMLKRAGEHAYDNYICRLTCLYTFNKLIDVVSPEMVKDYLYPPINILKKDHVPNIRFNVAKCLYKVAKALKGHYNDLIVDEIKPTLELMASDDDDVDVKFFANASLSKIIQFL